uniref:Uncharacterized protein n=1 Tax=viral metagenome TaxID=1070528 RepID=A0A6C0KWS1_9ZZZZ
MTSGLLSLGIGKMIDKSIVETLNTCFAIKYIQDEYREAFTIIKNSYTHEIDISGYCRYTYDDDGNIVAYYFNSKTRKIFDKHTNDKNELLELQNIIRYAENYLSYPTRIPYAEPHYVRWML